MMQHTDTTEPLTLRNERRDFPEWHLGRPAYALWALEFDTAVVMPHMEAAQRGLAPWLLEGYCRQPHITLSLCGLPNASPLHADDFGPDRMHAQVQALQRAQPAVFEIEIGGLDTFSSVPYLAVQEPGGQLAALRACLANADTQGVPDSYVAHVTVGLYADVWPLAMVQTHLDRCVLPRPVRVPVTGVSLLSYAAAEIGGPLQCLASYTFGSGRLHWHGTPLFVAANG